MLSRHLRRPREKEPINTGRRRGYLLDARSEWQGKRHTRLEHSDA